ncbi:FkbM family methyltransferase [Chryseobacterium foetidum]|uniref:FkbM family methyltransferase n=1 Tax=Chryseobacterium foetidum TaxID=2951057 RepID=UPI0021C9EB42|nr:FkbM family methyltransferase [Chryseobacterium foetidum]
MNPFKSLSSTVLQEGIINFIKRKKNITFLDNRTLFKIKYNNTSTKIFLNKKFGYVDNYIFTEGIYEKDVIDNIRNTLNKDLVMLDIGSNIGQHSLILAPYCKRIFAFEPISEIYTEFQNSIKANNYKNIVLQNVAIGNKKETKSFYFNPANTGASSFLQNSKSAKLLQVKIDLLSNVLPKEQRFDVVKIDVEGYEAVVILGNKELFLKNRPTIFLEFSPTCIDREGTHSSKELTDFILENNYQIFKGNSNKPLDKDSVELNQTGNWILKPL